MAFWRNYGHLVWTTKNRAPFIQERFEERLYAQLKNRAGEMDCFIYAINGMTDHVHVALAIPPKHSIADVVKQLKGASSHFVNHIIKPPQFHFAWQRGYGYLSLGERQLPQAVAYVQNQKIHHAEQTVNAWLEKTDELDDGPMHDPESISQMLREEPVAYRVERFVGVPF